ncbi:cytochrome P450 [Nocardia fluminea]|uniref:cytochrome P450 n=1 Tax=Nocardia fluminea TaxID=134984 RepID=UPI003652DA23
MAVDTSIPRYRGNLFSTEAILDPYPHYAALRAAGPVVWLPRQRVFAISRYAECKAVLRDDATFVSGYGVSLNPIANRLGRGTTLNSDAEEHTTKRSVLAHRLTPKALREVTDTIERLAESVVDKALAHNRIDGVDDLATALPLSVVPDLIGWPHDGRAELLRWAGATFDSMGPINRHSVGAAKAAAEMLAFARRIARDRSVLDDSMGSDVFRAADEGRIDEKSCPALMIDYLAPSLDTTIGAISSALYLFAQNPEQWRAVRSDPGLIPQAVNEVVRIESPLRAFSRTAARDADIGGTKIPGGSRVLVLFASANRDPAEWDQPESFDITRDAARQIGFGWGVHGCAGRTLARLETTSMLRALADRVERIELAGTPKWAVNNIIRRLERLPLELVPADRRSA